MYLPLSSPPRAACSGFWTRSDSFLRRRRACSATRAEGMNGSRTATSPPPDVYIIAPHCPHCGRPERPAAVVHGPAGPTHFPALFCSSPRPLSATCRAEVARSPATGSEAHAAKTKLDRTLEASALYPPELRAAELALVSRAACTSSLEVYGSVARCGWDESDAYLRKQRDHVQPLCTRLSPAWNYGEWAAGFYSQLRIRVVSADGLTQGYTPEEGYAQGNTFSANGYQGGSVLASSALPFPRHIHIPPWPSPAAIPVNRVSYSDDGAFFEPTIALVSDVATECVRATLHTDGVPNMDKLEFSYHTLSAAGLPRPEIVDVPRFKTRTLPIPPLIVGIPIFHTLKPTDKLNDLLRAFRTVYHFICDKSMAPLLMIRSFIAFALSRWDFVFSGLLASPDWLQDMHVYARRAYRTAFSLPLWTCNAFLHLPLHAGGVGCPSLPLRNLCLLTLTYLHASVSRNPLSPASAAYLLATHAPFSKGQALRTSLATLHTRVHTHPFPHLHDMRVHTHIASDLPMPGDLWIVTDGALTGHRLGGGIVFFHPQLGVLKSFSFGIHVVAATSADAEWLAKLVARDLLQDWDGQAFFLADDTASMHCAFTKAPPPLATLLNHLFRQVITATVGAHEFWVRAQHDTGHTHTLALLQREAHHLAAKGASQALPFTAPLLPLLGRAALATYRGRLLLNAQYSIALLHDQTLVRDASLSASWDTSIRSAATFAAMILNSSLPRAPLVLALRLRALLFSPPPATVHYYTCDYCDAHVDHPWFHVTHTRPSFLLRSQWAFVRVLSTLPKLAGSFPPDGTTVVMPSINTSVSVALETDQRLPSPLPTHRWTVFSPTGLVKHVRPPSPQPEGTSDRVRAVLESMTDPSPSLTDLLMVLDKLEWPTRPSSDLSPHVSVQCPQVVLPLSVVFLTRWTTCHVQSWRMLARGRLPLRMPPPPPPPRAGPPR